MAGRLNCTLNVLGKISKEIGCGSNRRSVRGLMVKHASCCVPLLTIDFRGSPDLTFINTKDQCLPLPLCPPKQSHNYLRSTLGLSPFQSYSIFVPVSSTFREEADISVEIINNSKKYWFMAAFLRNLTQSVTNLYYKKPKRKIRFCHRCHMKDHLIG